MANDDTATMIDALIADLTRISKGLRDTLKNVDDFQNELKRAKDLESKELKQMIQKRNQLFKDLTKITDKYDQTAKDVIQKIGR